MRWILGSYASEDKNISVLGIPFKSGEYQYYLAIAPDLSLITIRTGDKEEIAQLEALADQFGSARTQQQADAIPGYEARGRIEKIQEKFFFQINGVSQVDTMIPVVYECDYLQKRQGKRTVSGIQSYPAVRKNLSCLVKSCCCLFTGIIRTQGDTFTLPGDQSTV